MKCKTPHDSLQLPVAINTMWGCLCPLINQLARITTIWNPTYAINTSIAQILRKHCLHSRQEQQNTNHHVYLMVIGGKQKRHPWWAAPSSRRILSLLITPKTVSVSRAGPPLPVRGSLQCLLTNLHANSAAACATFIHFRKITRVS